MKKVEEEKNNNISRNSQKGYMSIKEVIEVMNLDRIESREIIQH